MVPEDKHRFHPGALERQRVSPIEYPIYHPTRLLEVGESHSVDIYADTRWNDSGLYLPKDQSFVFSAEGEWQDSKDNCNWLGTEDGKLTAGDIIRGTASFLGKFESIFKKMTKNQATDFLGTKRIEAMPWFVLVGAIANDNGRTKAVTNDGSPTPHQYVELPKHTSKATALKIKHPGYLYCFPNDVWSLYENNHGSVLLTVTRIK